MLARDGVLRASRRVGPVLLFGVVPVLLTLAMLAATFGKGSFLYDFHGGLYGAGRDIVHGHSPYRPAYLALQAAVKHAGGMPHTVIDVPVYPPVVLIAAVPFSLLPYTLAAALFAAISIGALILALRLLEVRDWRCYGLAFASWPVLSGLRLGALSPLLVLGAAVAWRSRATVRTPAIAIASVVVAKLFPWPLAAWLLVTKRFRSLALAIALAAAGTLAAWAVIDFHGLLEYPRMLANLSYVSQQTSVSLLAGLLATGVPVLLAKATVALVTGALLLLAWRRRGGPDGDRRALGLAVIAALVASPMVWPHYLALVFVPIALASPRLSALWFVPMLAYLAPVAQTGGNGWRILPYLAIEAIVVWRLCAPGPVAIRAVIGRLRSSPVRSPECQSA